MFFVALSVFFLFSFFFMDFHPVPVGSSASISALFHVTVAEPPWPGRELCSPLLGPQWGGIIGEGGDPAGWTPPAGGGDEWCPAALN